MVKLATQLIDRQTGTYDPGGMALTCANYRRMPQPPQRGARCSSSLEGKMMRITVVALGLTLLAAPALAQSPDISRMLQGLTTGNQNQDQALREAYERGYRAGQQDAARHSDRSNRSRDDNRSYDRDRDNDQPSRRSPTDR